MKPWVGISLMHEADFIEAALPLFEKGEIEIIEWSFDTIAKTSKEPEWMNLLLKDYSLKNRLIGHGVRYSLLSGKWEQRHIDWLKQLSKAIKKYNYRHITEHFGFMTSDHFHKGAPLPVPFSKKTLAIGQDRLKRLQQIVQLPVGIENLAFAFSEEQIKEQGEFLEKLIEPVNGFLILDLHNIWCQSINFNINPVYLIKSYPLDKVREIHISGGSWSIANDNNKKIKVRRDTHDEAIPSEVFDLLQQVLRLCNNVEAIIFERLGNTIHTQKDKIQFAKDFRKIKKTVSIEKENSSSPAEIAKKINLDLNLPSNPVEDLDISMQQKFIIDTLNNHTNPSLALQLLKENKSLKKNNWNTHLWTDYMVETAMQLLKKWN